MTPDLVDVIAERAADDHCDRESCGAGDCVHARNVEMLCEEWRDQRDEIARLGAALAVAQAERDALQASNGRLSFALAEAQLAANASWRCFKCGMVLTDESAARAHFGDEKCVAELRRLSNDMRTLCNTQARDLTEARQVLHKVAEVLDACHRVGALSEATGSDVASLLLVSEIAAVLEQEGGAK